MNVDATGGEGSGDVVAASVASYSEDPEAFANFSAQAVAGPFAAFAARLAPGATVLDAGCGPGRDLARLAALGHRGVGVDLNRDFVARALARAHGLAILGDLRALPLLAGSFDAIWASASLIHLPHDDMVLALGEIARVARSGALISISVRSAGVTGWADDLPMGRRWFSIWAPHEFANEIDKAQLIVEEVLDNGEWVEVRARR